MILKCVLLKYHMMILIQKRPRPLYFYRSYYLASILIHLFYIKIFLDKMGVLLKIYPNFHQCHIII